MNENKRVLAAVGKLFDREYKFITEEELDKINGDKAYKTVQDALIDEACEQNAIAIRAVNFKNNLTDIYVGAKHESLKHMEINVPLYIAETQNIQTGVVVKVITDLESLSSLNTQYENVVNMTMLNIPDDISMFFSDLLYSYLSAKATFTEETKELQLDENIVARIEQGDTIYSVLNKLVQLI